MVDNSKFSTSGLLAADQWFQVLKIQNPLFTLSRRNFSEAILSGAWGAYNFVAGDVSSMWTVFLGTSLSPSLPKQYMTRTRKNNSKNSNNTYTINTFSSLLLLLRPLLLPPLPLPPPPVLVLLPFFKIIIHITQMRFSGVLIFRLLSLGLKWQPPTTNFGETGTFNKKLLIWRSTCQLPNFSHNIPPISKLPSRSLLKSTGRFFFSHPKILVAP